MDENFVSIIVIALLFPSQIASFDNFDEIIN